MSNHPNYTRWIWWIEIIFLACCASVFTIIRHRYLVSLYQRRHCRSLQRNAEHLIRARAIHEPQVPHPTITYYTKLGATLIRSSFVRVFRAVKLASRGLELAVIATFLRFDRGLKHVRRLSFSMSAPRLTSHQIVRPHCNLTLSTPDPDETRIPAIPE